MLILIKMNDVLIGFTILIVFTIICFGICVFEKWHEKDPRKYHRIFTVTTERRSYNHPAGICVSIESEYFVTVYGVTWKGKRKRLYETLAYKDKKEAETEGELIKRMLMKKYKLL